MKIKNKKELTCVNTWQTSPRVCAAEADAAVAELFLIKYVILTSVFLELRHFSNQKLGHIVMDSIFMLLDFK